MGWSPSRECRRSKVIQTSSGSFCSLLSFVGMMTPLAIKLLSGGLVAVSLLSLNATCRLLIPDQWFLRAGVLLLVATNSAIVTWTTSGLENPLTLLLACELLRITSQDSLGGTSAYRMTYLAVLVAALAMTRPEGIAFVVFPPLAMAMAGRRDWPFLALYSGIVAVIFMASLAFRYVTFGDWVPNTFHAKGAAVIDLVQRSGNVIDLLQGPFGSGLVMIGVFWLRSCN